MSDKRDNLDKIGTYSTISLPFELNAEQLSKLPPKNCISTGQSKQSEVPTTATPFHVPAIEPNVRAVSPSPVKHSAKSSPTIPSKTCIGTGRGIGNSLPRYRQQRLR